ncbi:MAG TPA: site-specific integrase [Opitutaceae bacterium]|nr:site-specific integrase [Opitutaceae bacterium]
MKTSASQQKTTWQRTSVQNLLRNRQSGHYYGRFTISGKQKWYALETDVLSVAKLRLADKAGEIQRLRGTTANVEAGDATMHDLIEVFKTRTQANSDIKPATVTARLGAVKRLVKTWPNIEALEPRQITPSAVFDWAARFKVEGTKFQPPGAKAPRKGNSATSVNSAIDALRQILDLAVERGQIHANPVTVRHASGGGRLKKKITKKALVLPSRAQLDTLFAAMEDNGSVGGGGAEAADFCRFLMMSGARLGEVPVTLWQHVQWERQLLHLPGFKSETSARFIPLFPELTALLRKIQERRKSAARFHPEGKVLLESTDPLLRLTECQKTIDAACKRTGVPRVTHHDFRHIFATTCIESGVDIPTVAGWLGHSDGGVLAMKTYGHLRPDHSHAAAQKVQFGQTIAAK